MLFKDKNDWKSWCKIVTESLLAIYAATFCIGLFFLHHGVHWVPFAVVLGGLYLFVFVVAVRRILVRLPMAAIMIAAPMVPLILLLLVLSLLPILQYFK